MMAEEGFGQHIHTNNSVHSRSSWSFFALKIASLNDLLFSRGVGFCLAPSCEPKERRDTF